jgi:hypothetical protein
MARIVVVHSRSRPASAVSDALLLLAIGMMAVAVLLPFMGSPAFWGDGLSTAGSLLPIVSWSLSASPDAQIALVILALLGVAAAGRVARMNCRITAALCAAASGAAVLFALFSVIDGGRGVVPSWFFEYQKPASLEIGFYVYIAAAVLSAVASLFMVMAGIRHGTASSEAPLRPLPS